MYYRDETAAILDARRWMEREREHEDTGDGAAMYCYWYRLDAERYLMHECGWTAERIEAIY